MIPPASTEPMHPLRCETCDDKNDCGISTISCPMTIGDINGEFPYDTVEKITAIIGCASHSSARGPVAQQAPASSQCFDCIDRICPMRDGISRENSLTCPGRLRLPVSFEEMQTRDAALIAQEREKWEREHTPKFHAENPGVFSPWYNVEMVAARVESARKKEREAVLGYLDELISPSVSDARKHEIVESLCSGVQK